ncbi:Hypothetical predicted protein [Octopus vulgaris]|uniref:Uncharacterized protein n=1 Tax=Octopus vulgaris TaxID=6645 RepID=A0AA36B1B7_OCTVU|nr:Hypothetical predicted protein [Octopus vulgaris]
MYFALTCVRGPFDQPPHFDEISPVLDTDVSNIATNAELLHVSNPIHEIPSYYFLSDVPDPEDEVFPSTEDYNNLEKRIQQTRGSRMKYQTYQTYKYCTAEAYCISNSQNADFICMSAPTPFVFHYAANIDRFPDVSSVRRLIFPINSRIIADTRWRAF